MWHHPLCVLASLQILAVLTVSGCRTLLEPVTLQVTPTEKLASVICPRTQVAPEIDGTLNDPAWTGGALVSQFKLLDGRPPTEKTWARICYDDTNLYVAFKCYESHMDKLVARHTEFDSAIWEDDAVEVFVDPYGSFSQYVHFITNSIGTRFDEKGRAGKQPSPRWNGAWRVATAKEADGWTAEFAVPWSDLGVEPATARFLGIGLARQERPASEQSAWPTMVSNFHEPERFATAWLAPAPSREEFSASVRDVGLGRWRKPYFTITFENNSGRKKTAVYTLESVPLGEPAAVYTGSVCIGPRGSAVERVVDKETGSPFRSYLLTVKDIRTGALLAADRCMGSYPLVNPDDGFLISRTEECSVWGTNPVHKVKRNELPPRRRQREILIEACLNDFEPFQVVITAELPLRVASVVASDFRSGSGATIFARNVTVNIVEYVTVTRPTDSLGKPGDYPDPLPPFEPFTTVAGRNCPLWITVYVPPDAEPGDYRGYIDVQIEDKHVVIPVGLKVWAFALPKTPLLRTAYGISTGHVTQYQALSSVEDRRRVHDLYMQNFRDHRIAPYDPMDTYPYDLLPPEQTGSPDVIKIDFTEYDIAARRYLDGFGFNGFSYAPPGELRGYKRFSPEYSRLLEQYGHIITDHWRQNGWLDKAYCYWFDEPTKEDYPFVVKGMDIIRRCYPGMKLLLTEEPQPELFGHVDIWVPLLGWHWQPEDLDARRKLGEETWWYVCCVPHTPFPNNFIDHPGVEHRVLFWMLYKYGLTGNLYWSTTYWAQNPWKEALTVSADNGSIWGNGDGRLVYPPVRDASEKPVIAGPVNSIRWELIREGMQDYEFLTILKQKTDELEKKDPRGEYRRLIQYARTINQVPAEIVSSRTEFAKEPALIYQHRRAVAETIERLNRTLMSL